MGEKLSGILADFNGASVIITVLYFVEIVGLVVAYFLVLYGAWDDVPYGYTSLLAPPYECCNCESFVADQAWYWILYALLVFIPLYGIWTVSEAPEGTMRMNIFHYGMRFLIFIFLLVVVVIMLILLWPLCNFTGLWFNPCNDPLWPCQADNFTMLNTTCVTCPSLPYTGPLSPKPVYTGMLIIVAAVFVYNMISGFFHVKYNVNKRTTIYSTSGEGGGRLKEFHSLAIAIIILAVISLLGYVIVVFAFSSGYIPAPYYYDFSVSPPVLVDETWGLMGVFYLVWIIPAIVQFMVIAGIYPANKLSAQDAAPSLLIFVSFYDVLVLLVALVAYLLHLTTLITVPEFTTTFYAAMLLSLLVQFVIGIVIQSLLMAAIRIAESSRD